MSEASGGSSPSEGSVNDGAVHAAPSRAVLVTNDSDLAEAVGTTLPACPGVPNGLAVEVRSLAHWLGGPMDSWDVVILDASGATEPPDDAEAIAIVLIAREGDDFPALSEAWSGAPVVPRSSVHAFTLAQACGQAIGAAWSQVRADRQRAWFEAVVEGISDFVAVVGPDRTIRYESSSIERVLGYTADERREGSVWDLVHPEDIEATLPIFEETLSSPGRVTIVQLRMRHKEGHWIHAEIRARNAMDDPAVGGLVVTIRDVSTERRMAEKIRSAEARFRALVEQSLVGIYVIDDDGRLDYVNPTWSRIMQRDAEAALGSRAVEFVRQEDRAEFLHRLNTCLGGEDRSDRFGIGLMSGEDRLVPAELYLRSVTMEGRAAVIGVLQDLTEQRALEAEYLHAQKMEVVGRLVSGVAHDFNNLLSAIAGCAHLIRAAEAGVEQRLADVNSILESVDRGKALTSRLLAFSRKEEPEPRPLDLDATLATSADFVRRILREDIEVRLNLDAAGGRVEADPRHLEQIVLNLAINAQDAMPSGGTIVIESTTDPEVGRGWNPALPEDSEGHAWAYVRVSDSGVGIAPDVLRRVFEPFFTTKAPGRGTGLGLATVMDLVARTGGLILADSQPDRGTAFSIRLPTTMAETIVSSGTADPGIGNRGTVLIIEDDPAVLQVTSRFLASRGYDVIQAPDAGAARAIFQTRASDIDVVLSDVVLPDGQGPDLAVTFREQRPSLPCVFMSGHTELDSLHTIRDLGAQLLLKPFVLADLVRELEAASADVA